MVPPLVGVAVKVVDVPAQIVVLPVMLTLTGVLLIVIVSVFEVAGPVVQPLEVSTQVTRFPFVNAELEKVALFVPALVPFTFH